MYQVKFEPGKASCTVHIQTIYGKTVHCQNKLNLLLVKFKCIESDDEAFKKNYTPHNSSAAEFKEFERRFKFKPRFKYAWFHLKLYQMFQDLSRR